MSPSDPVGDDFESVVRRLGDARREPNASLLRFLSGARREEVGLWQRLWAEIEPPRRRWIARHLLDLAEADFQVDFKVLFIDLLGDDDPAVRAVAVDGLWESHDQRLLHRFTTMLRHDTHPAVRARAAVALGVFIELAQLERIAPQQVTAALAALTDAAVDESEDVEVRRRATESAGFADYEATGAVIEAAADSDVPGLRAGALRAMGHSGDERWAPEVLACLADTLPELRFEAARAAGALELAEAIPALVRLTAGPDREIQGEAVWALGEIGGPVARRVLECRLAETDDRDLVAAIEDALAAMTLSEGDLPWAELLDVDPAAGSVPVRRSTEDRSDKGAS